MQNVSTKYESLRVIQWMQNAVSVSGTDDKIASNAVAAFREIIRGSSYANRIKARNLWTTRFIILEKLKPPENSAMRMPSRRSLGISRRSFPINAFQGRGRKRTPWVDYMHSVLVAECGSLSTEGIKFSIIVLLKIALQALSEPESPFRAFDIDSSSGNPIKYIITLPLLSDF